MVRNQCLALLVGLLSLGYSWAAPQTKCAKSALESSLAKMNKIEKEHLSKHNLDLSKIRLLLASFSGSRLEGDCEDATIGRADDLRRLIGKHEAGEPQTLTQVRVCLGDLAVSCVAKFVAKHPETNWDGRAGSSVEQLLTGELMQLYKEEARNRLDGDHYEPSFLFKRFDVLKFSQKLGDYLADKLIDLAKLDRKHLNTSDFKQMAERSLVKSCRDYKESLDDWYRRVSFLRVASKENETDPSDRLLRVELCQALVAYGLPQSILESVKRMIAQNILSSVDFNFF